MTKMPMPMTKDLLRARKVKGQNKFYDLLRKVRLKLDAFDDRRQAESGDDFWLCLGNYMRNLLPDHDGTEGMPHSADDTSVITLCVGIDAMDDPKQQFYLAVRRR